MKKAPTVCKLPRKVKKHLKNMEPGVKNGNYDSSEMRIFEVRKNKITGALWASHVTLGMLNFKNK